RDATVTGVQTCALPIYQGLEVVAADLGDVYFNEYVQGRPTQQDQLKLKFAKSYEALNLMKYSAVGVGVQEFRYGLLDALGATVLDRKSTRLNSSHGSIS